MSLISDMQRDLTRREAREQGHPSRTGPRLHWPAVFWGFAVALVLVALATLFWPTSKAPVSEPAVEPVVQAAVSASSAASSQASAQASSARPVVARSAADAKALQTLLARAGRALADDRLTRPATDNAYLYYQQALALAPDDPAARQGLAAIAERYRQLAERAQARGDSAQARRLARRGLMVDPAHARLQAFESASSQTPPETPLETASAASSQGSSMPDAPAPSVQLTPASREARVLEAARTLRRQGEPEAALERLLAYLPQAQEQQYAAPEARRLAQRWLIERGRLEAAGALVVDDLPPAQRAFLQARVDLERDALGPAIARLEQHFDSAGRDEPYRALLAALYRKNGQFVLAEGHYRRLLDVFGSKGRYWLGLALALDQQGEYPSAAGAYRQVLVAPTGTGEGVRAFAERRLEQLGVQSP